MPQLQPNEIPQDEQIQSDNIPFRQRLMDRFEAHEYVRVKNIDNEEFAWHYMPSRAEQEYKNPDGTHTVIGRRAFTKDYSALIPGNEEYWSTPAGGEEVLLGENAYMFIEGIYKRVVAKRLIKKTPNHKKTRNFNWGYGNMQEELIDEIYLGKETPVFSNHEPAKDTK